MQVKLSRLTTHRYSIGDDAMFSLVSFGLSLSWASWDPSYCRNSWFSAAFVWQRSERVATGCTGGATATQQSSELVQWRAFFCFTSPSKPGQICHEKRNQPLGTTEQTTNAFLHCFLFSRTRGESAAFFSWDLKEDEFMFSGFFLWKPTKPKAWKKFSSKRLESKWKSAKCQL